MAVLLCCLFHTTPCPGIPLHENKPINSVHGQCACTSAVAYTYIIYIYIYRNPQISYNEKPQVCHAACTACITNLQGPYNYYYYALQLPFTICFLQLFFVVLIVQMVSASSLHI